MSAIFHQADKNQILILPHFYKLLLNGHQLILSLVEDLITEYILLVMPWDVWSHLIHFLVHELYRRLLVYTSGNRQSAG